MSAFDQAISAHQQALDVAAAKAQALAEEEALRRRQIEARAESTFRMGVKILNKWFQDVEWSIYDSRSGLGQAAGYGDGSSVVVWEQGHPELLLMVRKEGDVYYVTQQTDTNSGYNYWNGPRVRSAADIGAILRRQNA